MNSNLNLRILVLTTDECLSKKTLNTILTEMGHQLWTTQRTGHFERFLNHFIQMEELQVLVPREIKPLDQDLTIFLEKLQNYLFTNKLKCQITQNLSLFNYRTYCFSKVFCLFSNLPHLISYSWVEFLYSSEYSSGDIFPFHYLFCWFFEKWENSFCDVYCHSDKE